MESFESLGRILGFDQQMLISLAFQWTNTIIMVIVLCYLLYKPVKNFMKNRTDRIKGQLDAADNDMKKARSMKEQYEQKLADIETERAQILDAARKRAHEKGEQIIAEARTEADLLRKRASVDVEREQEKAKDEVKTQIIEISSLMAKRYVASAMNKETASNLIDKAIADMGDAKWLS